MVLLLFRNRSSEHAYIRQIVDVPSTLSQMLHFLDTLEQSHLPTKRSAVPLRFSGGRQWQDALEHSSRVTRDPDKNPNKDPTIGDILDERYWWVGEIYQAMMNLRDIRDPQGAEVKLFTPGHKRCDEKNIEAKCWLLFATVVDQVTNGYRGSRAQTFARAKRDDRDVNTRRRLENVVKVLRDDKRVCKDILQDPTRMVDLAYVPLTVADKKLVNEKNNSTKKEAIMELKRKVATEIHEEEIEGSSEIFHTQDSFSRKASPMSFQSIEKDRAPTTRHVDATHAPTDSDLDGEFELDSDYTGDDLLGVFNKFAHPDPSSMFPARKPASEHIFAIEAHGTKRSLPKPEKSPANNLLERRYQQYMQENQTKKRHREHDA